MKVLEKMTVMDILFYCIVINILPVAFLKFFGMENIYTSMVIIIYGIQVCLMLYVFRKDVRQLRCNKRSNKLKKFIIAFLIVQMLVQLCNIIFKRSVYMQDIGQIIAVTINTVFFFYLCVNRDVTTENILDFMKKMVQLGVLSCIVNIVHIGEMIGIFFIENPYSLSISSWFPNRNQFGIFMLICIISNTYVIQSMKDNIKKYLLIQILFCINLIMTLSRNSIMGLIMFTIVYLFQNRNCYLKKFTKEQIKRYIITIVLVIVLLIGTFILIFPNGFRQFTNLFIRPDTIDLHSGRLGLWIDSFQILLKSPLIGLGRFQAVHLNQTLFDSSLNQFHSLYVETMLTYGILGLWILFIAIKRIFQGLISSNIKEKTVLIAGMCSFLFISCFESTTRFSMGYADTIGMIFFFVLPLIFGKIKTEQ